MDDSFEQDLEAVSQWILEDIEQIALPDSLRSERLLPLLADIKPSTNRIIFPNRQYRWVGLAACLALALLVTTQFFEIAQPQKRMAKTAGSSKEEMQATPELAMAQDAPLEGMMMQAESMAARALRGEPAAEQLFAASYDEVYARIERSIANKESFGNPPTSGGGESAFFAMETDLADEKSSIEHENTQPATANEADIVKTDGSYLYHYRRNRETGVSKLSIVEAKSLVERSAIELADSNSPDIYLAGERLVVVESLSEANSKQKEHAAPLTQVAVYDVSDKESPKLAHHFYQSGSYRSSRLADNVVYTLTQHRLRSSMERSGAADEQNLPFTIEQANTKPLPAEAIWLGREEQASSFEGYTVLSAIDLANDFATTTKAVAASGREVLLTEDSLYLTADLHREGDTDTSILKFAVDRTGIAYVADTTVQGIAANEFALDEYQGNLRIATTSFDAAKRVTENGMYVFDAQLSPLGQVIGFAETDRIYSTRYNGEYAYLATFRQPDLLIGIDLADPTNPVVQKEVAIPGLPKYLHPVGENTLLGIGQNTRLDAQGVAVNDGLKLSLFDISDPARPTEKTHLLVGNASGSLALSDHKAVLYYPEKQLVGLPVEVHGGEKPAQQAVSSYLLVEITGNGLKIKAQLAEAQQSETQMRTDAAAPIERGVYIGDTLYTLSAQDVCAFDLSNDCKQIGLLKYEA